MVKKNIGSVPVVAPKSAVRFTQDSGAAALANLRIRIGFVSAAARFAKQYPGTVFASSAAALVAQHEADCRKLLGVKSLTYSIDVGTDRPAHADMGTIAEVYLGKRTNMRILSVHSNDANASKAIAARKQKAVSKA